MPKEIQEELDTVSRMFERHDGVELVSVTAIVDEEEYEWRADHSDHAEAKHVVGIMLELFVDIILGTIACLFLLEHCECNQGKDLNRKHLFVALCLTFTVYAIIYVINV